MKYGTFALLTVLFTMSSARAQFSGKVCFVTPGTGTGVGSITLTNADDQKIIDSLVSWGFTVDIAMAGNTTTAGSFNNATAPSPTDAVLAANYKLVFYSEFTSSGNGLRVRGVPAAGPYNTINLPVVSLDNWFVKNSCTGIISSNTSSATTFINTTTNTVDCIDASGSSFSQGFTGQTGVQISTATTEAAGAYLNYCMITPAAGQTILPIAAVGGTTNQLIAWGAEKGTTLYDNAGVLQSAVTLKHRYAAVGIMGPAYAGLTAKGALLIKNAITWALEGELTGVRETVQRPSRFSLGQNYPNPFNPSTTVQYSIGTNNYTSLRVFDVLGRMVAILVNENKPAGTYRVTWDASSLPTGIYFYKLDSGSLSVTKKMMLVK